MIRQTIASAALLLALLAGGRVEASRQTTSGRSTANVRTSKSSRGRAEAHHPGAPASASRSTALAAGRQKARRPNRLKHFVARGLLAASLVLAAATGAACTYPAAQHPDGVVVQSIGEFRSAVQLGDGQWVIEDDTGQHLSEAFASLAAAPTDYGGYGGYMVATRQGSPKLYLVSKESGTLLLAGRGFDLLEGGEIQVSLWWSSTWGKDADVVIATDGDSVTLVNENGSAVALAPHGSNSVRLVDSLGKVRQVVMP